MVNRTRRDPEPVNEEFEHRLMRARVSEKLLGISIETIRVGRFELESCLGKGGMGEVWRAYDPELERRVALKLLRPDIVCAGAQVNAQLRREARALARLQHPNVVRVFEVVEAQQMGLVMELISGSTVAAWLRECRPGWSEVLDVFLQAAKGLQAAHEVGIAHRDFKPSNILIDERGQVLVADFGLARELPDERQTSTPATTSSRLARLVSVSRIAGTPAYMAPEQRVGQPANMLSDQFSFCVSLYEGLYGHRPYWSQGRTSDDDRILDLQVATSATQGVPTWLHDAVVRGLARTPERRWASMDELIGALESGRLEAADMARARWRKLMLIGAVFVFALAGLGLVWPRSRGQEQVPAANLHDLALMKAASESNDPTERVALFREIRHPEQIPEFEERAAGALRSAISEHVLIGHDNAVIAAEFSPDGTLVATASRDKTARIWTVGDRSESVLLAGHSKRLTSLAFSPDGTRVVTSSLDGTARVWSADNRAAPIVLRAGTEPVLAATFSPDGSVVAAASGDGVVRLWNLVESANGRDAAVRLEGHGSPVSSVRFHPDGTYLLTGSSDGTALLWALSDNTVARRLSGHGDALVAAEFSPAGDRILTASQDGAVRIWGLAEGATPVVVRGHDGGLNAALFSPDGNRVAVAAGASIRLWSVAGEALGELHGHHQTVHSLAFSRPGGDRLASAAADGEVRVWYLRHPGAVREVRGHAGRVGSVAFSPDGRYLVTAGWVDYSARVWPVPPLPKSWILGAHDEQVRWFDMSPDGGRAVTGSIDGTLRVWPLDGSAPPLVLRGHRGAVRRVHFGPSGTRVVSASMDGTARVWNADGRRAPAVLADHEAAVMTAVFDPTGLRVLTGSNDRTARIWNTDGSGEPIVLRGHDDQVFRVEPCPDSRQVFSMSTDETARLWTIDGRSVSSRVVNSGRGSLYTGACSPDGEFVVTTDLRGGVWLHAVGERVEHRPLSGHRDAVVSVRFSSDGGRLATSSKDGVVRIWSLPEGALYREYQIHSGPLENNEFSPDGTRVFVSSRSGNGLVLNLERSSPPLVLLGHTDTIPRGLFSPDGSRVVTVSHDTTVRVWRDLQVSADLGADLWRATTYCMPVAVRQQRFGRDHVRATRDLARCREQVSAHTASAHVE